MPAADPADAVFSALADGTRRDLFALLGRRGEASATDPSAPAFEGVRRRTLNDAHRRSRGREA